MNGKINPYFSKKNKINMLSLLELMLHTAITDYMMLTRQHICMGLSTKPTV